MNFNPLHGGDTSRLRYNVIVIVVTCKNGGNFEILDIFGFHYNGKFSRKIPDNSIKHI